MRLIYGKMRLLQNSLCFVRRLTTERSRIPKTFKRDENSERVSEVEDSSSLSVSNENDEGLDSDEIPLTFENQYERLAAEVTPLWRIPYPEQLQVKWQRNQDILLELKQRLKSEKLPGRLKKFQYKLHKIIPSPLIDEYRNKDEFRIKRGVDGNPKTVGILVGSLSKGTAVCVNPDKLITAKESHKIIAHQFEKYIRQSPLPMCDLFSDGGIWRGINVRSNQKGDIMATVIIHPQNLSEEELDREKELLSSYFSLGPGKECGLTSLYFQACRHSRCTNDQAPYQLLFGEPYIYEKLCDMRFRISPDAFFQVNTLAAECLSKTVNQLCNVDEDTILLDVYSGTGIISLPLASQVRSIIGIEINKQAVEDAKVNAELNGIKNSTFLFGKAENVLPQFVTSFENHKVVAIVNPTRSGLHPKMIRAIRELKNLNRLVYVSCKPDGKALDNFHMLGKPPSRKLTGQPFIVKQAVPLDMFPHTKHCELIVLMERMEIYD